MKKILAFIFALFAAAVFTACGSAAGTPSSSGSAQPAASDGSMKDKKVLIAYFSRTGENYAVGNISKGNTHIVADIIGENVKADMFEIKTVKEYPAGYKDATEVAKKELEEQARPELQGKVGNMKDYDVIFLGYPIWWSDLPMPVYTFLESYDFNGKTIIPFMTSAGDYMTGKEDGIAEHAKGAKVLKGIGLEGKRAQDNPDAIRADVKKWLAGLGF